MAKYGTAFFIGRKGEDMRCIRVETLDRKIGRTKSGYIAASFFVLGEYLGVNASEVSAEMLSKVTYENNPKAYEALSLFIALSDIPIPKVYKDNEKATVCLYRKREYNESLYSLMRMDEMLNETSKGRYRLVSREIEISGKSILYDDGFQVVIPLEKYIEKIPKARCKYVRFEEVSDE